MHPIPQRQPLVAQTIAYLTAEINRGKWTTWLPSERLLCDMLQVSRNTLRAALAQMKRDGSIQAVHGAGNRIVATRTGEGRTLRSHDVAFLTPEPLERLRPTMTLWIDELRALLNERGCRVHLFHGSQYFRAKPGAALKKLVAQNVHGCWILALSNESVQRWFEANGVPCVVAGSIYAGLNLPFRDLDHRAMCRHAAGMMLSLGHRKVAFVIQRSRRAGDVESELGFIEGVRQSPHGDAEPLVISHDATVASISHVLRRLMAQKNPPTAILVANPYHYLTVISRLMQAGWQVPKQVSVICRDEDPFLSFLVPAPACYMTSPHLMAKTLLRPVLEVLENNVTMQRAVKIMPEFIRGESIGPAPTSKS